MKSIELKVSPNNLLKGPKDNTLTTKDLIQLVLETVPPGGFSFEEMKKRLRIQKAIDALAEDATELPLEDADHEELGKLALAQKWGKYDDFIYEFVAQFKK